MSAILDIITAKRDGKKLTQHQIAAFVDGCTRGTIPDYQASAFLMAAFCRGMDADETVALTRSMLKSSATFDLSDIDGPKVDKHSTGGVGDKISLILTPLVACCGLKIPMISGRGLGITGGTKDKMDSIPGVRTDLSIAELRAQLSDVGVAIIGQTSAIAPADKLLYALRDVTATVDFIPFISASIMSKKLAEGLDGLVLDVKCGRGAFMNTEPEARRLAESLVTIGLDYGVHTSALLTRMDQPLGRAIGNWIEVEAAIRFFEGDYEPDVAEVTFALAGEMLHLGGLVDSAEAGRAMARDTMKHARVADRFAAMVAAQGGNPKDVLLPGIRPISAAPHLVRAPANAGGYVNDMDAGMLGSIATQLGVGRAVKEDPIDPDAGIMLRKKTGDVITPGAVLAHFYTKKISQIQEFRDDILEAYQFSPNPPAQKSAVMDRLTADGWQGWPS